MSTLENGALELRGFLRRGWVETPPPTSTWVLPENEKFMVVMIAKQREGTNATEPHT